MKGSLTIGRDAGYQMYPWKLWLYWGQPQNNWALIKLQKKKNGEVMTGHSYTFFVYEHISAIGCHNMLLTAYLKAHEIP